MPPVSRPALEKNATPTEIRNTPVKMATASSVSVWGTATAGVAGPLAEAPQALDDFAGGTLGKVAVTVR